MQIRHTAFVALLLTLSSCAVVNNANNEKPDTKKYSTMTTHNAVNLAETNIRESDTAELDIYAPDHFITARKALEEAKALLIQSQPREKIVQKVAVAEAVLRNGDMVMRKVKTILAAEIKIKNNLDSINTQSTYGAEYGSLNERFNKIIREIEGGNGTENESREQLLKDMQQLERKALHYNAMNEPQEILKRVKYSGGEQLAPLTYNEAIAVFKRAEEFIAKNPNFEAGIIKIGHEALFAAKRALYVTEGVSSLKQKVAFAPEQVILDEEYRLYRVARQLADFDYRDNSLEVQSELLAKGAKAIALELKNKDELVIALRDTLIKVRDSSSQLTLLSESTERLKAEKNRWLAKEALFTAKVDQLATELKRSELRLDATQQKLLSFKSKNSALSQQINTTEKLTTELNNKLNVIKVAQQEDATKREAATLQANKETQIQASKIAESQATIEAELLASKTAAELAKAEATNKADLAAALLAEKEAELLANKTTALETNKEQNLNANKSATLLAEKEAELQLSKATARQTSEAAKLIESKLTALLAEKKIALLAIKAAETKANEAVALLAQKDAELQVSKAAALKANSEVTELLASNSKLVAASTAKESTVNKIPAEKQTPVAEKTRAKITEEETLKALESVKELISTLKKPDDIADKKTEIRVVRNNSSDDFLDDEDAEFSDADDADNVFVDAGE